MGSMQRRACTRVGLGACAARQQNARTLRRPRGTKVRSGREPRVFGGATGVQQEVSKR